PEPRTAAVRSGFMRRAGTRRRTFPRLRRAFPRLDPAGEDLVGERRFHQPLDDLPHRPRPESGLVAALRDQVLDQARPGAEGGATLVPEAARAVGEQQLRDLRDLLARERSEDKPFVEPRPEL